MASNEIQFNVEVMLSVPHGIGLDSIKVRISPRPASAGCVIYGYNALGNIQPVEILGGGDFDLPFVNPQIFIRYLEGLEGVSIATLGWTEARGATRPSQLPPGFSKH